MSFTPYDVTDDVLTFHAKGNYVIDRHTQHLTTLHNLPPEQLQKLTNKELRLNPFDVKGDRGHVLPSLGKSHALSRNDSCSQFEKRTISFSTIEALLSPLLVKAGSTSKRGYPSGGAIYPVEVFCVNLEDSISSWPSQHRTLHLLSNSKTLESYQSRSDIPRLREAILPFGSGIGRPCLAVIYCVFTPKAIFKYRYRGYRLALMEAGSMYMLTDLRAKELGLHSRPWSGFTDHKITKYLDLNPTLFLPACIQLIG